MQKIIRILSSRITHAMLLLLLQIILTVLAVRGVCIAFVRLQLVFRLLSLCVVCRIVGGKGNPAVKISWVTLILLLPLFGGVFYLVFGTGRASKKLQSRLKKLRARTVDALPESDDALEALKKAEPHAAAQAQYLQNYCFMPLYRNTRTRYLPVGESAFRQIMLMLQKAERFIFIEFFIISEGKMWNAVLSLLEKKVSQGVEVRVLYDDTGSMATLPRDYPRQLRAKGIKCAVFNPYRTKLTVKLNNRDHRKLVLVDGVSAVTGGFNLSDEYINIVERHGYWKDSGVFLEGEAVLSFTLMFLETWNVFVPEDENYRQFIPKHENGKSHEGFVQPYHDCPFDGEHVGGAVYLNMISRAVHSVCITTPYLIIDDGLITALCLAAKSGVTVKIITPGIVDHWYVRLLTESYYPQLIEAGVEIYEYTPGFMHAKNFIVDDCIATIGSINLDYRSLYHMFECGVWMYRSEAVAQIKEDFLKLLPVCTRVTRETCDAVPWYERCVRSVMRFFAPLF